MSRHRSGLLFIILLLVISHLWWLMRDPFKRSSSKKLPCKSKSIPKYSAQEQRNPFRRNVYAYHFQKDNDDVFISKFSKNHLLKTLWEFDRVWSKTYAFKYMLFGGSLLGSYRHGGMIPFDDDLDVLVDVKHKRKFPTLFKKTPLRVFKNQDFYSLALMDQRSRTVDTFESKLPWPYIDVFFFRLDNTTHLSVTNAHEKYLMSEVFPPIKMPFENRLVPAPRCVWRHLVRSYGPAFEQSCCTHKYNHRFSRPREPKCMPCAKLLGAYRFTRWQKLNGTHAQQQVLYPSKGDAAGTWQPGLELPMSGCAYSNA